MNQFYVEYTFVPSYYVDGRTAQVADFLDPAVMDSLIPKIESIKHTVEKNMPRGTKLWFGETGSAFGGGAPNLSNTYAAGFLYVYTSRSIIHLFI